MRSGGGDNAWSTSDLGTAAYAKLKGLKILGIRQTGGGKYMFIFDDPNGIGSTVQVDFMNSECRDFDSAVRSLKKLCYDSDQGSKGGRKKSWANS